MQNRSTKITITGDSTGEEFRFESAGPPAGKISALGPFTEFWLDTVNSCRRPGVSDTKITQQLFDTVARRVIDAYGESVLLPVLFNLACKHRGDCK